MLDSTQLELPTQGKPFGLAPGRAPNTWQLTQDTLQVSLVPHDRSRKFHKCLNLLVLVLGCAGRGLKPTGVGVLRGNRCESRAPWFSFAFAKGGGLVEGEGRKSSERRVQCVPLPPAGLSWGVWKCAQQHPAPHPGRCECLICLSTSLHSGRSKRIQGSHPSLSPPERWRAWCLLPSAVESATLWEQVKM